MSKVKDVSTYWNKQAKSIVGKKVVEARYMTEKEKDEFGFECKGVKIVFNDGSWLVPSRDDEGNDAGALLGANKNGNWDFPVIY